MTQSLPLQTDTLAVVDGPRTDDSKRVRMLERKLRRLQHRNERIEQLNDQNLFTSTALRRRLEEDVAQRELMLTELSRQKELAEAATEAKANFLANVSHEIRTPMNGVIGMLELLQGTELTTEQGELAQTASTSALRLLDLIDDLLNFSKIEAGRVDIETMPFVLRSCLDECIDVVRLKAHRQGLRLYVSVDSSCPYSLVGDPARLRQVVLNLLNNAIKFTHRGHVHLKVHYEPSESMLHLEVADTGVGIDADRLRQIFEPFSQADSSVTRRFGGTGLGLSISKSLVEAMGGEISVSSESGQGSMFSFSIKVAPATLLPSVAAQKVGYLIEDELESKNLQDILHSLGCEAQALKAEDVEAFARSHFVFADCDHREAFTGERLVRVGSIDQADEAEAFSMRPLSMRSVADRLRTPRARAPSTSGAVSKGNAGALRVLVAEDNRINQAVIRRFLEREGHAVDIAEDGVAALEQVASGTYDLILMDVQMPRMSGYEAARRLRSDPNHAHLPIVAITANAGAHDRQACIDAGMDNYLTKPVHFDSLRQVLTAVARKSR